jgi:hypothetical protein
MLFARADIQPTRQQDASPAVCYLMDVEHTERSPRCHNRTENADVDGASPNVHGSVPLIPNEDLKISAS